jgi:hypothetical protein
MFFQESEKCAGLFFAMAWHIYMKSTGYGVHMHRDIQIPTAILGQSENANPNGHLRPSKQANASCNETDLLRPIEAPESCFGKLFRNFDRGAFLL